MRKIIWTVLLITLSITLFTQTRNVDNPKRGRWDFQLKKTWEIEEAGDNVIGLVQNIRAAKDGRIYILDSKNFKVYIFSKEGKFISSFGRKGEGPGEIRNVDMGNQLFVVNDDILYVDRSRIHYFSLDGIFRKTIIISSNLSPRRFISGNVFISAPAGITDPRNKVVKIKLYNIKDKSERIISEYRPFEKASDTKETGGRRIRLRIFINTITPMMLVKHRSGKIYFGMSDSYKINIVDLNGKEIGSFFIEGRKQKNVSAKFKKDLLNELGDDLPQDMVKKILNGLPKKASFFQEIVIDKNGLIYIFVSDPDNDSHQLIDIFSPAGKYLYSSELKVEEGYSIENIYLRDDLLVITTEDEDGNLKVAKYSVTLPNL